MNLLLLESTLGVAVGVISAALGVGGGIIMVPAFREFIPGMDQPTAIGTSLFTIIFVAAANSWRLHRGLGPPPWRLVAAAGATSALLAYLSGLAATRLDKRVLTAVFACLALGLALRSFRLQPPRGGENGELAPEPKRTVRAALIGVAMGLASGLTGIGGGGVFVPLALWARIAVNKTVVGISNSVMVITALAGAAAFLTAAPTAALDGAMRGSLVGQVHLQTAALVFVGAQVGSPVGKWINARLSQRQRMFVMGSLLVFISVRMALRALG